MKKILTIFLVLMSFFITQISSQEKSSEILLMGGLSNYTSETTESRTPYEYSKDKNVIRFGISMVNLNDNGLNMFFDFLVSYSMMSNFKVNDSDIDNLEQTEYGLHLVFGANYTINKIISPYIGLGLYLFSASNMVNNGIEVDDSKIARLVNIPLVLGAKVILENVIIRAQFEYALFQLAELSSSDSSTMNLKSEYFFGLGVGYRY